MGDVPTTEEISSQLMAIHEEQLDQFPVKPKAIKKGQRLDKMLKKKMMKSSKDYSSIKLKGAEVITYKGEIYVPRAEKE